MPLLISFLFFLSSSFSTIVEAKRSRKLHDGSSPDFRDGRHVGVDVQCGIGFPIAQGTLL